jgi:hypothetical protein
MKQNDRVQGVATASDPLEAFDRARELTLGDFFEQSQPPSGQPHDEKMILLEAAVRETIEGFCRMYDLDRLKALEAVAIMLARLVAVDLTCPNDIDINVEAQ